MPDQPHSHRRSIRLYGHDYTLPGEYFVTVCVRDRAMLLANSHAAEIVARVWSTLPDRWETVEIDAFVVMPNHMHGVIVLSDAVEGLGAVNRAPTSSLRAHAPRLGEVIRVFKASATRRIREMGCEAFAWQRNYYEHIIRTETSLATIRQYIIENPERWEQDPENPDATPDVREAAFWRRYGSQASGTRAR